MSGDVPDYSGESSPASPDLMRRLNTLVLEAARLEMEEAKLEEQAKAIKQQLRTHKEKLLPELLAEMGMTSITTKEGIHVELKDEVRVSFPKSDQDKRRRAFAYLEATGDDGLIKREFVIQYGRGETSWAQEFSEKLVELNVAEHATVEEEWNIHHQTLLAYLKRQIKDGKPVPLEDFGAFVQSMAKIKLPEVG